MSDQNKMQQDTEQQNNYAQYILPCVLLFLFIYFVIVAKNSLFPFVLSAALAYILNPLVNYFAVRGIKRLYVVYALYILAGLVLLLAGYIVTHFLSPQFVSFQESWPKYVEKIQVLIQTWIDNSIRKYPFVEQMQLQEKIIPFVTAVPQYIIGLFPALSLVFLVPFITFFMLVSGSSIIDYILDHIPSKKIELVYHIVSRIDHSLGNYMRGILTEAFLLFLLAFLGLTLLGLNYAGIIAILIGLSSLIPYLGAFIGAVVASIVAYVQFGSVISIFNILVFFCCLRFFDDWFLQPYIMNKAVELNPAIIVLALMSGWEIGGFWGVIFAIPVTCIIKEILLISVELQETEFRWKPHSEPTRTSIPYT